MGGEVVLKLPFILGHVDSATSTEGAVATRGQCTLPLCRGIEVPDPRDRWASTRLDDPEDTTTGGQEKTTISAAEPEPANKENEDDDDQVRQQSQSTDDSHRTGSVEDFIIQQESAASANWRLSTMDECSDIDVTPEKPTCRDTVRQSTITTTLARANATDIAVEADDMIVDAEEHSRRTKIGAQHLVNVSMSGRKSRNEQFEVPSNNRNENAKVITATAQIHTT